MVFLPNHIFICHRMDFAGWPGSGSSIALVVTLHALINCASVAKFMCEPYILGSRLVSVCIRATRRLCEVNTHNLVLWPAPNDFPDQIIRETHGCGRTRAANLPEQRLQGCPVKPHLDQKQFAHADKACAKLRGHLELIDRSDNHCIYTQAPSSAFYSTTSHDVVYYLHISHFIREIIRLPNHPTISAVRASAQKARAAWAATHTTR